MPATIRIKRSASLNIPTNLKVGELAYSYADSSNALFIGIGPEIDINGSATRIAKIGGEAITSLFPDSEGIAQERKLLLLDESMGANYLKLKSLAGDSGSFNNLSIDSSYIRFLDADSAIINGLISDSAHIIFLEADSAYIHDLIVDSAYIQFADIDSSHIDNVTIDSAYVRYFDMDSGHIDNVTIDSAYIKYVDVDSGHIDNVTIDSAYIKYADIDSGHIDNVTIDSAYIKYADIDSGHIDNVTIDSAYIKYADIDSSHIDNVTIDSAYIKYADIDSGHIDNVTIDSAYIKYALIDHTDIDSADIGQVDIDSAYISRADIDSAYVGKLMSDSAEITYAKIPTSYQTLISGPDEIVIDPSAVGDNTGRVLIKGDLQVDGLRTIVNSTVVTVNDKNIVLADSATDSAAADGAGISVYGATFNSDIHGRGAIYYQADASGFQGQISPAPGLWKSTLPVDIGGGLNIAGKLTGVTSIDADSANLVNLSGKYVVYDSGRIGQFTADSAHIQELVGTRAVYNLGYFDKTFSDSMYFTGSVDGGILSTTTIQGRITNDIDLIRGSVPSWTNVNGTLDGIHLNKEIINGTPAGNDSSYYHLSLTNDGKIFGRGLRIGEDINRPTAPVDPAVLVYNPQSGRGASYTHSFYGIELNDSQFISTLQKNIIKSDFSADSAKIGGPNSIYDSVGSPGSTIFSVLGGVDSNLVEIKKDGSISFQGDLYKEGAKYVGAGIFSKIFTPTDFEDVHFTPTKRTAAQGDVFQVGGRMGLNTNRPRHTFDFVANDGIFQVSGLLNTAAPHYALQPSATVNSLPASYQVFGDTDSDKSRLLWDPAKARFRAGYFKRGAIQSANMGLYSTALGRNTLAKDFSFAQGDSSEALSSHSFSSGYKSIIDNNSQYAIAIGAENTITNANVGIGIGQLNQVLATKGIGIGRSNTGIAQSAIAIGDNQIASGISSIAIGQGNQVTGQNSIAIGAAGNVISGTNSVGIGENHNIGGSYNFGFGDGSTFGATTNLSFAFGKNVEVGGDYSFGINLGTGAGASAFVPIPNDHDNFMSIQNGNVTIGSDSDLTRMASPVSSGIGNLYVTGDLIYSGTSLKLTPSGALIQSSPWEDNGVQITYTNGGKPIGMHVAIPNTPIEAAGDRGFIFRGQYSGSYNTDIGQGLSFFDSAGSTFTSFSNFASDVSLMGYYPKGGIFRVGSINVADHRNDTMGAHSIGMGYRNKVNAAYGAAIGGNTSKVIGDYSVSLGGNNTEILGTHGAAIGGNYTEISGTHGAAIGGQSTRINGNYSISIGGQSVIIKGDNSISISGGTDANYISSSKSYFMGEGNRDSGGPHSTYQMYIGGPFVYGTGSLGTQSKNYWIGFNNTVAGGSTGGVNVTAANNVSENFIFGQGNTIRTTNGKGNFIIGRDVTLTGNQENQIILNNPTSDSTGVDNTKVAIGRHDAEYALDVRGTIRIGGSKVNGVNQTSGDSYISAIIINDQDIKDYIKGVDPTNAEIVIEQPPVALPTATVVSIEQSNPGIVIIRNTNGILTDGKTIEFTLPSLTNIGQFLNDSIFAIKNVVGGIGDSFELYDGPTFADVSTRVSVNTSKGTTRNKGAAGNITLGSTVPYVYGNTGTEYDPAQFDSTGTAANGVPTAEIPFGQYVNLKNLPVVAGGGNLPPPSRFETTVIMDSDLIVAGTVTLNDSVGIGKDLVVGGNLDVSTGYLKTGGFLDVTTYGIFGDSITVGSTAVIGDSVQISGDLTVAGALSGVTTFKSTDSMTIGGDLTVAGALSGVTTFTSTDSMTIGGALSGVTTFTSTDSMTIGGALSGVTTFKSTDSMTIGGALSGVTTFTSTDSMTIGGDLTVAGTITGATNYVGTDSMTIGGDLTISGALSGVTSLTASGPITFADSIRIGGSVRWLDNSDDDSFYIGNLSFDSYVLRPGSQILGAVLDYFDTDYVQQRVDSFNSWQIYPDAIVYNPTDKHKTVAIGITNNQAWTGWRPTINGGGNAAYDHHLKKTGTTFDDATDDSAITLASFNTRHTSFSSGLGDSVGLDIQGRINIRTGDVFGDDYITNPPIIFSGNGTTQTAWPNPPWLRQTGYIDQPYVRAQLDGAFLLGLFKDTPSAAAESKEFFRSMLDSAYIISIWDSDYYWKHDSFNAVYIGAPGQLYDGTAASGLYYDGNIKLAINKRGDSSQYNLDLRGDARFEKNLVVEDSITMMGNLSGVANLAMSGSIETATTFKSTDSMTIGGALSGVTTFKSTDSMTIGGALSGVARLTTSDSAFIGGNLRVESDLTIGGGLTSVSFFNIDSFVNIGGAVKIGSFNGRDSGTGLGVYDASQIKGKNGLYVGDSTHLRGGLKVLGHDNILQEAYTFTIDSGYLQTKQFVSLNNTQIQNSFGPNDADSHIELAFTDSPDFNFLKIKRTDNAGVTTLLTRFVDYDSLGNRNLFDSSQYGYGGPSHNLMTNENRLKNVYVKEPSVVNTDTLLIGEEIVALPDSNGKKSVIIGSQIISLSGHAVPKDSNKFSDIGDSIQINAGLSLFGVVDPVVKLKAADGTLKGQLKKDRDFTIVDSFQIRVFTDINITPGLFPENYGVNDSSHMILGDKIDIQDRTPTLTSRTEIVGPTNLFGHVTLGSEAMAHAAYPGYPHTGSRLTTHDSFVVKGGMHFESSGDPVNRKRIQFDADVHVDSEKTWFFGAKKTITHVIPVDLNYKYESDGAGTNFPTRIESDGGPNLANGFVQGTPIGTEAAKHHITTQDGYGHFNSIVPESTFDSHLAVTLDSHIVANVRVNTDPLTLNAVSMTTNDVYVRPGKTLYYGTLRQRPFKFLKQDSDGIGGLLGKIESDGSYDGTLRMNTSVSPAVPYADSVGNPRRHYHEGDSDFRLTLDSHVVEILQAPPLSEMNFQTPVNFAKNARYGGTATFNDSATFNGNFTLNNGNFTLDSTTVMTVGPPILYYKYESDGTGSGIKTTFSEDIRNNYPTGQLYTRFQHFFDRTSNHFQTFNSTKSDAGNVVYKYESDGSPIFGGKGYTTPNGNLHFVQTDSFGVVASNGHLRKTSRLALDSHIERIVDSDFIGIRLQTPWKIINATAGISKKIFYDEQGAVIIGQRDTLANDDYDTRLVLDSGNVLFLSTNFQTGVTIGLDDVNPIERGNFPNHGAEGRLMWIPERGAFRVGALDLSGRSNDWKDSNVGYQSIGIGNNTKAAHYGTAIGYNVITGKMKENGFSASKNNLYSVSVGQGITNEQKNSVALGIGIHSTPTTFNHVYDRTDIVNIGHTIYSAGTNNTSIGYRIAVGKTTIGPMVNAANAQNVTSIGRDLIAGTTSDRSVNIGLNNKVESRDTLAVGDDVNIQTSSTNGVGVGKTIKVKGSGVALGRNVQVKSSTGVVIGKDASVSGSNTVFVGASGGATNSAVAVGKSVYASNSSVAIGRNTKATGTGGLAFGHDVTSGSGGVAIGSTLTGKTSSVLLGRSVTSSSYTVSVGSGVNSGYASVALGSSVNSGSYAVAIGKAATSGSYSVSLGKDVNSASYAVAIGRNATANSYSVSIGQSNTSGTQSVVIGKSNTTNSGTSSEPGITVGISNTNNTRANIFGKSNTNNNDVSIYGSGNSNSNSSNNNADYSLIYGHGNVISEYNGLVYGKNNTVSRNGMAYGSGNDAKNEGISFGYDNEANINSSNSTHHSFAFGRGNSVDRSALAFGRDNVADNQGIAIGRNANADGPLNGDGGISLGRNVTSFGANSMAIGTNIIVGTASVSATNSVGIGLGTISNTVSTDNTLSIQGGQVVIEQDQVNIVPATASIVKNSAAYGGGVNVTCTKVNEGGRAGTKYALEVNGPINVNGNDASGNLHDFYVQGMRLYNYIRYYAADSAWILSAADSDYVKDIVDMEYIRETTLNDTFFQKSQSGGIGHLVYAGGAGSFVGINLNNNGTYNTPGYLRYGIDSFGIYKQNVDYTLDVNGNVNLEGLTYQGDVILPTGGLDSNIYLNHYTNVIAYNIAADSAQVFFDSAYVNARGIFGGNPNHTYDSDAVQQLINGPYIDENITKVWPDSNYLHTTIDSAVGDTIVAFRVKHILAQHGDFSLPENVLDAAGGRGEAQFTNPTFWETTFGTKVGIGKITYDHWDSNPSRIGVSTNLRSNSILNVTAGADAISTLGTTTPDLTTGIGLAVGGKVVIHGTQQPITGAQERPALEIFNGHIEINGEKLELNSPWTEGASYVTYNSPSKFIGVGQISPNFNFDVLGKINADSGLFVNGINIENIYDSDYILSAANETYIKTIADSDYILSTLNATKHIIPELDISYDLGSTTNRFRDLYLSGSSINLGDITINAVSSGLQLSDSAGNLLKFGGIDSDATSSMINANYVKFRADSAYVQSVITPTFIKTIADSAYIKLLADSDYIKTAANEVHIKSIADSDYIKTAANEVHIKSIADSDYIKTAADSTHILGIADSDYIKTAADSTHILGIADSAYVNTILKATGHILPALDSTFDLGSPTHKFKDLYLSGSTINLGGTQLKSTGSGIQVSDSTGTPSKILGIDSNATIEFVDSSYVSIRTPKNKVDSSYILGIADSDYIKTTTDSAYIKGIVDSSYIFNVADSGYIQGFISTPYIRGIIDSAHINSITGIGTKTVDFGGNKIYYNNSFAQSTQLPSATTYKGMFVWDNQAQLPKVAVGGNWMELARATDVRAIADSAAAALVASAPATLDTLNELAAAIGDDANFSTTITNSIAAKLPLSGGTMTGAIDMGSNNITTTGKMLYSNVYSAEGDLPSASTYHGMFAHVHGTGKGYFAHGGNWIKLANFDDITTDSASIINMIDSAYVAARENNSWATISGTPTTIAGYGITDAGTGSLDSALTISLIDSSYVAARVSGGGGSSSFTSTITSYYYTATSNQTVFSGSDQNSNTLNYNVNSVTVFLNGINLLKGTDYTTTSSSTITLINAANSGDEIVINALSQIGASASTINSAVTSVVDSAYVSARVTAGTDSASIINMIDSGYIQARENNAWSIITGTPTTIAGYGITDAGTGSLDSALTISLIDSAYIQARQTSGGGSGGLTVSETAPSSPSLGDMWFDPEFLETFVYYIDSDNTSQWVKSNPTGIGISSVTSVVDSAYVSARVTAGAEDWTEITTSPTTASANQRLIINTSTTKIINLPSSANLGDEIRFIDGSGNANTNNITINRNGHKIEGNDSDLTIDVDRAAFGLVYYNVANGWLFTEK